jgi:hypothetical protein
LRYHPCPSEPPSTRNQDACAAWAQSECKWKALCGLPFPWVSGEQCVTRETLRCELLAADPGVSFDEEGIRGCQFPRDCTTPPPVCWPQGRTPVGQPCLWNEACHSEHCIGVGSVRLGICGLCLCDVQCSPGQECQIDSSGGTCVPLPRGPGESCAWSTDCQSGQCITNCFNGRCIADFQGPFHCAPFGQLNDPCGLNDTPKCDPDLACDANRRCNAIPAQCSMSTDSITGVDGGVLLPHCDGFAKCNMSTGACEPPANDGQPCDADHGCVPPAACVANHCIFPTLADCSL